MDNRRSVFMKFLTVKIYLYVWDEINHHFSFSMTYTVAVADITFCGFSYY